jgi:transcription initiation factor TFIID subunit 3
MKKHSKTGVESRFQGTVLGHPSDPRPVKIEGGPVDSIQEWCRRTRENAAKTATEKVKQANHVLDSPEGPEDVAMESQ